MATYKTTPDDFKIFQDAVRHWQKFFGLLDWQIYTRHKTYNPECQAYCIANLPGRAATIYLSKSLHSYDNDGPGEILIQRMAFHEVCELLMARLKICARARYITPEEIEEAIHEVIRTLEHVVFDREDQPVVSS